MQDLDHHPYHYELSGRHPWLCPRPQGLVPGGSFDVQIEDRGLKSHCADTHTVIVTRIRTQIRIILVIIVTIVIRRRIRIIVARIGVLGVIIVKTKSPEQPYRQLIQALTSCISDKTSFDPVHTPCTLNLIP